MTATVLAGVVDGLPDADYHAHGALSSTGARTLVKPGGPAVYAWRQAHPEPHKSAYDRGHAAHLYALGIGPEVVVVDAADWRTKAAKEQREAAYAGGAVPLLVEQHREVVAMANALHAHPLAGPILKAEGAAEQSLFWTDPATDVPCRARIDWRTKLADGRDVIVDYKTTHSAAPDALPKVMHTYGYHQQGMFYLDGARHHDLADDESLFLMIFQEKAAPYMVSVRYLDPAAARIGHRRNVRAREIWRDCTAAGQWPGYPEEALPLSLPAWAEIEEDYA